MIIYEDQDILVCRKPAGVPVQSAKIGTKDMVSILNNYLAEKEETAGEKMEKFSGAKTGKRQIAESLEKRTTGKRIEEKASGKQTEESPGKNAAGKRTGKKSAGTKEAGKRPAQVRIVHRLDQPVEGVMVFAKTKRAASELGKQISGDKMTKVYEAVCCVTEEAKKGILKDGILQNGPLYCLTDYLVRDGRTNTSAVAKKGAKDAKLARLEFSVLERYAESGWGAGDPDVSKSRDSEEAENPSKDKDCGICGEAGDLEAAEDATHEKCGDNREYLLVRIHLMTGRHHQIRVQMANAGLPLYGDRKYNKNWRDFLRRKDGDGGAARLALCAVSLTFFHPATGKKMEFQTAPGWRGKTNE